MDNLSFYPLSMLSYLQDKVDLFRDGAPLVKSPICVSYDNWLREIFQCEPICLGKLPVDEYS